MSKAIVAKFSGDGWLILLTTADGNIHLLDSFRGTLFDLHYSASFIAITQLVHHGMIFVPIGYALGAGMFEMEKVKGGSPCGAGTCAGDWSRLPSELKLKKTFRWSKYFVGITRKLK